jgi:hypothetical protein
VGPRRPRNRALLGGWGLSHATDVGA